MTLAIRPTPPDHPQVQVLLAELDAYLASLYDPEDIYALDLASLMDPSVTFLGAWHDDTLVGCGAVRLMPAEPQTDGRPYGEIKRMRLQRDPSLAKPDYAFDVKPRWPLSDWAG